MPPPTSTRTLTTSLTLLALLRAGPQRLRTALLRALRITTDPDFKILVSQLLWIAGISGVITGNKFLNYLARNNWRLPRKQDWYWPNEVAVVTGGSGGIGACIVKGLAETGINVAVVDIVEPKGGVFAKYKNVHFFHCDITSKEAVDALAADIKSHFGAAPSILCNNAGIAHAHTMLEASPAYLRKLFDINVLAHFYTLQAFLPDMVTARKGHIVSTCSMSSFVTPAGLVDYAATKAAVMAMHEGLQGELKWRYNAPEVKTSIVHPVYVRTPLCESYAKALEVNGKLQLSPEMVGEEVAKAVLSGSSEQIILPRKLGRLAALRALPWWVQELARSTVKEDMKRL